MAELRADPLPYGHLGEPVYDAAHRQWLFSRNLKQGTRVSKPHTGCARLKNSCKEFILRPISSFIAAIPPSAALASERRARTSAQVLQQQARALAARHPELTPGLASITSFAHTSYHIASLTATHDPLISDRLAFGRAGFEDTTTNIVAIAAGKAGNVLRFIRVKPAHHSCSHDQIRSVTLPEIDTREEGWWSGNGAPIQQIACADGNSTWMAVRLLDLTVILRPRYRKATILKSAAQGLSNPERLFVPRLDPNPVTEISIRRTGGVPHADVKFNPWHQRQIAIVDQQGAWSVWDLLTQEQEIESYGIKSVAIGHVFDSHDPDVHSQDIGDGWGALCFAGSAHILVVCNRRHMAIFHVPSRLTQSGVSNLDLLRNSDWILDLRTSSRDRSHIFVVTSSQVFCIHVAEIEDDGGKNKTKAVATTLRSWCHFREGDDTSLRLDVIDHDRGMRWLLHFGQDTMTESLQGYLLLLYSRQNDLVTIFHLSFSSVSRSHAVVSFDPYAISLSSAGVKPYQYLSSDAATLVQCSISNVTLRPALYKYRVFDNALTSDPDTEDLTESISFYKLFVLRSDLSLCERVFVGRSGKAINDSLVFALNPTSQSISPKGAGLTPDDGMIDSEDGEAFGTDQMNKIISGSNNVAKQHSQSLVGNSDHNHTDQWTVNSELLYGLVTEMRRSRPLAMSSLTLDEQDRTLSLKMIPEMVDKKFNSGASGIKSL